MKLQNMYIGSAMSKDGCLHLTTVSKKGSHTAWLWKATRFIMCVGLSPLSTIFCLIVFVHNDISIAVCLSVSQHVLYMSFRLQAPISHHSRKDSENPSHTVGSHQQASEMWQVWGQHPECGLSGWYIRCSVSFYCNFQHFHTFEIPFICWIFEVIMWWSWGTWVVFANSDIRGS